MKKIYGFYFIVTFVLLMMLPIFIPLNNTIKEEKVAIKLSETITHTNDSWLDNPTFEDPIEPTWYPILQGDISDVDASTSLNQADITVVGESREKEVLLNNATQSNWMAFIRDESQVVPQRATVPFYGVDDEGAWCSHWWWEGESGGQPRNTPEMHWKTNVSMPVDMSDYIITSLSFNAIINASVDRNIDVEGDTTARWNPGVVSINQEDEFDSVKFIIYISNLAVEEKYTFEIGRNKTSVLGNDTLSFYDIEGNFDAKEDQAIIDAINNVLAADPGHDNFTIVLRMDIYCEDNYSGTDRDHWDDLRFKSLNLTFSYEKKIDQFTSGSWVQDLDAINGSNVRITGANLNFKYKMDQNWTEASKNSYFLIYINEREYDPSEKFKDYVYSGIPQEAGGYDITEIMLPYENFTLSIQVYLGEDFALDNNITISITEVNLYISWTETIPDPPIEESFLFLGLFIISVMGATALAAYLIAYQLYLKYPVPVRKVRKYRKTLSRDKSPSVGIVSQKTSFGKNYHSELKKTDKYLKGKPSEEKAKPEKILKEPVNKTGS